MEDFLPNYSLDSLEEEEDGEKEGSKERIAVQGADKYEMQKEEKIHTIFNLFRLFCGNSVIIQWALLIYVWVYAFNGFIGGFCI